jgi:hypothetical protein
MEYLKRFLLVGLAVVIMPGTLSQLVAATGIVTLFLAIQLQVSQFASRAHGFLAFALSTLLAILYLCSIVVKVTQELSNVEDHLTPEQRHVLLHQPTSMIAWLFASTVGGLMFSGCMVMRQIALLVREEQAAKQWTPTTMQPPHFDWQPGRTYAAFLSHFKLEAASDARCELATCRMFSPLARATAHLRLCPGSGRADLHDVLRVMLRAPVFLGTAAAEPEPLPSRSWLLARLKSFPPHPLALQIAVPSKMSVRRQSKAIPVLPLSLSLF